MQKTTIKELSDEEIIIALELQSLHKRYVKNCKSGHQIKFLMMHVIGSLFLWGENRKFF